MRIRIGYLINHALTWLSLRFIQMFCGYTTLTIDLELVANGQGPTRLHTHHSRIIVSRARWLHVMRTTLKLSARNERALSFYEGTIFELVLNSSRLHNKNRDSCKIHNNSKIATLQSQARLLSSIWTTSTTSLEHRAIGNSMMANSSIRKVCTRSCITTTSTPSKAQGRLV